MSVLQRPRRRIVRVLPWTALVGLVLTIVAATPGPALASHSFSAANAQTAVTAFSNTYYNSTSGLWYSSIANHGWSDLWTAAYVRKGMCVANANTGGAWRQQVKDQYYGFENYFKAPFTWTETYDGVQHTTTDPTWWGEGVHDANDDLLWDTDAAICEYEATGDVHMLNEAEATFRYILETQLDSTPGYGDFGVWRTWSTRDYKDISTTGQIPYIAVELAKYFPTRTVKNNALGTSYTYMQYAVNTYNWVKSWIQPDGSILNGTNGNQTGFYDKNHYMMNVGLIADDAAALYSATGDASYINPARKVIDWARNRFTIPYNGKQILWPQWTTSNGGTHYDQWVDGDGGQNTVAKGIMARGIINFMSATGQTQYMQWMEDNADTAWANRHLSDNLLYTNWQTPNTLPTGSYSSGNFTGIDIMERLIQAQTNPFIINAGFESDQVQTANIFGWSKNDFGNSANDAASFAENKGSLAHSGNYILTHYKNAPYQIYTYQTVTGLPNGTYSLSAYAGSSGGQTASYMEAKDYGGSALQVDLRNAPAFNWTQYTINNINVTNHQVTIGFYSNAGANQFLNVDDVQLTPAAVSNPAYTARNFSLEDDNVATPTPSGWSKYDFGNTANDAASFSENKGSLARTGNYILTHYKNAAYQIYTYQTITGLTNGTYKLTAWVGSSGGQTASYMDIKDFGNGQDLTADTRSAPAFAWTLVTIDNVPVTNGQATIGFYSNAAAGQFLNVDDINLARQ